MSTNPIQTPSDITDSIKKNGFTVIQSPSKAKVDIVLIHGVLRDNPCWTSDTGVFWPYMLLAPKIPDARILSYTYKDKIGHSDGKTDASKAMVVQGRLISALAKHRKEKESKSRPIFFVAHCLGGVILEGAIVDACNDDENGNGIVSCIRGILLLGTPHFKEGLEPAAKQYFKYAMGSKDAGLPELPELPEQFPDIISTTQKFLDFQRKKKEIVKIKSFCASNETPVNQNLAQLSQGSKPQLLDRDHLQLSQFVDSGNDDSGNDDFEEVLQTLTDWLENIDQASEEHSGPERDEPNVNFSGSKNSGIQLGTNKAGIHGLTFSTTYGA